MIYQEIHEMAPSGTKMSVQRKKEDLVGVK
jgi:hypothetical protein